MSLGEGADGGADGSEAVLAGGGEIFDETELGEGIGVAGGDLGGRGTGEKFAEQRDEAANERRVGVSAEVADAVAELADEMNLRDAAADARGVGALGSGERREFFRAVDDGGEALLRVGDDGEGVGEVLLFFGESHEWRQMDCRVAALRAMTSWARKRSFSRGANEPLKRSDFAVMSDHVLIPLPKFALPDDLPWRVGFVMLVDEQLKRLRTTGHFLPGRFFGYFFQADLPVSVSGSWTVTLDAQPPVTLLPGMVEQLTDGRFSIVSAKREAVPDYLLVHDRHDGTCWLWSFLEGMRFLEANEPVSGGDATDDAEKPRLLGP
jgi:hypothetical protein